MSHPIRHFINILTEAATPDITQTPEFRSWFGNSKIVDAKGRPLLVYHGTTSGGFETFRPYTRKGEQLGFGIHFAVDHDFAKRYADDPLVARKGKTPQTYVAYLSIQNPLDAARLVREGMPEFALAKKLAGNRIPFMKDEQGVPTVWLQNAIDAASPARAQRLIQAAGYDGIRYDSTIRQRAVGGSYNMGQSVSYVVFDAQQVMIVNQ